MDPSRFRLHRDESAIIGVALSRALHDPFSTHTGVVYRAGDELHFLHHAWHLKLQSDTLPDLNLFVVPDLPEPRARIYARLCVSIANNLKGGSGQLPYALRFPLSHVINADSGEVFSDSNGLNCSNFVLCLFEKYGFKLVAIDTWPQRPEDAEWHKKLVAWVRRTDSVQADKIEPEIGCLRIRPEEVTAAASYDADQLPIAFDRIDRGYWWTLALLDYCGSERGNDRIAAVRAMEAATLADPCD